MLAKLKQAIEELRSRKEELLELVQEAGWIDDRPQGKLPEERQKAWLDILEEQVIPERASIPLDAALMYQEWYSAVRTILSRNQPSRLAEFDDLYSPAGKSGRVGIKQLLEKRYVTKDEQFELLDLVDAQFAILAAVPAHIKFSTYGIELAAYAMLMDDDLEAARHLLSKGFARPAGVLAGVILERHLKNLLRKRTPPIQYRKNATLATINDLCKETIYDVVVWRKVQHLTDLRNLCAHDSTREPSKEEVSELIAGVSAAVKLYSF